MAWVNLLALGFSFSQASERHLADERLKVKALMADVDRLSCEKLDVQERFDATKVNLSKLNTIGTLQLFMLLSQQH